MDSDLLSRPLQYWPPRRTPRLVALVLLTAIACWGEPGAPGAATPADALPAAAASFPDDTSSEPAPIEEPARPPTPAPLEPPVVDSSGAAATVARPAAAPGGLAARAAPKLRELSGWVKSKGGQLGFALRDLGTGRELMDDGAELPLNPASNQKLLTAAAALSVMGPDFRFHVGVHGEIREGVAARLVLRGNGDPSFSYEELRGFAERLVERGLTRVSGDILVDQSAFDAQYTPPAYNQRPSEWAAFRAPVSAVALDRNSITLHVFPTKPGSAARVEFEPPGYVTVKGEVRTEKGKKRDHVGLTLRPHGTDLLAQVGGDIPDGKRVVHLTRRIDNPEIYAGVVLKRLLLNAGVTVQGGVAQGGADEQRELVGRDSPPLGELVTHLGKQSDNFYAETLLKALGAHAAGRPGTSEKGAAAVVDWLAKRQLLADGLKITNGSGLYDANRVSARTLTKVLEAAYLDGQISKPYLAQLAVGGVDGTLRGRFFSLKKRASVHAKTGTLNEVVALSGYVFGPERASGVAFSLMVTGIPGQHARSRQLMDALVLELSDALWESDEQALAQR